MEFEESRPPNKWCPPKEKEGKHMADAFRPINPQKPAPEQVLAQNKNVQQTEETATTSDDPLAKGLAASWDILPPQVVVRRSMKKRQNMI